MSPAKRTSKPRAKSAGGKAPARGGAPKRPRDAELNRFTRRVADLMLAYVAAGRATGPLKESVARLKRDIDEWRDRTGRKELRSTVSARRNDNSGDGWTCKRCLWIMPSMGRICFLTGCDPEYNECDYICFTLPRDPNYPVS